jgi:methionyl-tRNA formyltransferase
VKAVVFAYHEIGSRCLAELLQSKIEVSALFTHKDDPEEEIWFSTPRGLASERAIPVFDPETLGDPTWVSRIASLEPDYLFSFYYRHMIPREILDLARVAPMNLHGSLLPRFRGRCPVNWVLVEGETETGVTLHIMEERPDAGDIIAQREIPIAFEDTAHTLALKLVEASAGLMREVMPLLETATFARTPQVGPSSYYGGRKPADGLIDWTGSAKRIYNLVRAVTHPYPGAFTHLEGRKLFIWQALPEEGSGIPGTIVSTSPLRVATGAGLLRITALQLEGEAEVDGETFVSTHKLHESSLGGSA